MLRAMPSRPPRARGSPRLLQHPQEMLGIASSGVTLPALALGAGAAGRGPSADSGSSIAPVTTEIGEERGTFHHVGQLADIAGQR